MIVNVDRVIELKPNAMLVARPELILEWDFEKNDELGRNIYTISHGAGKVWWIGRDCGHPYNVSVGDRTRGQNCPYCANSRVLVGFNDMWTTNPALASMLLNEEDGYKYTQGSNEKADWKCLECNKLFFNRKIKTVKNEGLNCSLCSNKVKYPERLVKFVLEQLNLDFYHDSITKWSYRKRYDFYLPDYNLIIETHGGQHYDGCFESLGGNTLEEEQLNDKYKYEMAMENGIENYVVIDCRNSRFNFIKNNIINSSLGKIINISDINWEVIRDKMKNTKIQNIAEDWNKHRNSKKISELNKTTIKETVECLLKATELGYCIYNRKEDAYLDATRFYQLDNNYEIVAEYIQDDEDFDSEMFSMDRVRNAFREMKKHKGFYWSKKANYENNKIKFNKMKKEYIKDNCVLQIDMNSGDILKEWDNIHDVILHNEGYLEAPLYNAMYGHTNSYKGFIWIKKKDYSKREINKKIKYMKGNILTKSKNKAVLKIDIKSGEILEVFKNAPSASKSIGVAEGTISSCLNNKKLSSGGFIWIREEDYNTEEGLERVKYIIKRKVELGDNDGLYGRKHHNIKKTEIESK